MLKGIKLRDKHAQQFSEELEIVSDTQIIEEAGWTFSELYKEREKHPYEVLIASIYWSVKPRGKL